jgi:hypothetical protein
MKLQHTLDDFETIREKLITDRKEVEKLLCGESAELCTIKAALKHIEEEIASFHRDDHV